MKKRQRKKIAKAMHNKALEYWNNRLSIGFVTPDQWLQETIYDSGLFNFSTEFPVPYESRIMVYETEAQATENANKRLAPELKLDEHTGEK